MTKKRKKTVSTQTATAGPKQTVWIIVTIAALVVSGVLIANLAMNDNDSVSNIKKSASAPTQGVVNYDTRVQLVASRFRCACGGCGELPLDECTCDMPRGAVEEKSFIRDQLKQGLSIDQVVKKVNEKYGHMES